MMFYSIIIRLIICLPVSLSYDASQCPMPWEWELRGKGYCNSSKDYSCLFNEITNKYEESCRFNAHELKLGEQYVLRLIPEGELCTNNAKYQPFKLNRLQTECTYVRSKCKEPGQVVFHRGNASKDTTCRCNFKEGWSFVSKPKALCFCEPLAEDCTCHMKKCPSRDVLTPGNFI